MNETIKHTGGCLCGAVRYEAEGDPVMAGYCYCADCRKASGFIPFMGFPSSAVHFSGEALQFTSKAAISRTAKFDRPAHEHRYRKPAARKHA